MKITKLFLILSSTIFLASCENKVEEPVEDNDTNILPGDDVTPPETLSVTVKRPDGSVESGAYVRWCKGDVCYPPVKVDTNGVAKSNFELEEGATYSVHLDLPEDSLYAYNPNIYSQTSGNLDIVLSSIELSSKSSEGNNVSITKEGVYQANIEENNAAIVYDFVPTATGVYEIESWVEETEFFTPEIAILNELGEQIRTPSLDCSAHNFKTKIEVYAGEVGQTFAFQVKSNLTSTFSFEIKKVSELDGTRPTDKMCEVTVKSYTSAVLADVTVTARNERGDFLFGGKTDSNGIVEVPVNEDIILSVTDLPKGHAEKEEVIKANSTTALVKVPTQVIDEAMPSNKIYQLNDIMYQFEITDTDRVVYSLKDLLATKEIVILNFWAKYCGPCAAEFPYLNEVWNEYKDQVGLLAISTNDSRTIIKSYKQAYGLDFPMAVDQLNFAAHFAIEYIPTTVVISKYGMVADIEVGSMPSKAAWTNYFNKWINYNW